MKPAGNLPAGKEQIFMWGSHTDAKLKQLPLQQHGSQSAPSITAVRALV